MSKVIDALNAARAGELTAIMQYMEAHYEMEDRQFSKLAKVMKDIAIQEMKHAEKLAERVLFLGGTPVSKPDGEAKKGLEIESVLKISAGLESKTIKRYNESIQLCAKEGDDGSKHVFESLLADEEIHLDTFENTLSHVEKLGPAYIATLAS
jgi:bacterioferritin